MWGVHCLSSSVRQQRCGEERPPGSHVTDSDCPLRRGHLLKRLRPRPRPVPRKALYFSPAATLSKLWWTAAHKRPRGRCSRWSRLRLAAEATPPSTSTEVNC